MDGYVAAENMKCMNAIKVILAEAEVLARIGLKEVVKEIKQTTIIGEAGNEQQLLTMLEKETPDMIILDYNKSNRFSPQTVQKVKTICPNVPILIISGDEKKKQIYDVLEAGATSFLTKECDRKEIIDAIEATAKGDKFFCNKVLDAILEKSFGKTDKDNSSPLTPRESQIVRLVAQGKTTKVIASDLHLSPHTVYTHRKNIMKKLNINSSPELIKFAYENGMIE